MEELKYIQTILERSDSRLSYDQLPNRHDIQKALKLTTSLINELEKVCSEHTLVWDEYLLRKWCPTCKEGYYINDQD